MKKLLVFAAVLMGAFLGLFSSMHDDMGLKIVMIVIGVMSGLALGAGISRLGKSGEFFNPEDSIPGLGYSPDERMETYWRDKGHISPMPGHPDPEGATRGPNDFL